MLLDKTLRKVNIGIYVSSKHQTSDISKTLAALDFGNTFPIHQCFLYQDANEIFDHHEFSFHQTLSTKREKGKDYFFKHLSNTSGSNAILFIEAGTLFSVQDLIQSLILLNKFKHYELLTPSTYHQLQKQSSFLNWSDFKRITGVGQVSIKFSPSLLHNNFVLVRKTALSHLQLIGSQDKRSKPLLIEDSKALIAHFHGDLDHWKTMDSPMTPLISCILPTSNRSIYINQSIHYFQEQSYSNKELIIVFNKAEDLPKDLKLSENIKLIQSNSTSIGAKRNEACKQARGLLIAQWDDDDIYHPNRLKVQAEPIIKRKCEISALGNIPFFGLDDWSFWTCSKKLHQTIFINDVAGGTLVYLKKVWDISGPYPNTSLREDADFMLRAEKHKARVQKIDGANLFVYLRHEANSWRFPLGKYLSTSSWLKSQIFPLVEKHSAFYEGIRILKESEKAPLVSCIMPTADRPNFIVKAIKQFVNQDFKEKELIIADNGVDAIEHLIPQQENIRYYRLKNGESLGSIRNFCCTKAKAEVIMHWDDDDFYANDWISYQFSVLKAESADVCGLSALYFYNPNQSESWKYQYPSSGKKWVAGATMAYTREFWRNNPFPKINIGEDNTFVWSGNPKVYAHTYEEGFTATIHTLNTSPKKTESKRWTKVSLIENSRIVTDYSSTENELEGELNKLTSSIQLKLLSDCKTNNYNCINDFENRIELEVLIPKYLKQNKPTIPKYIHQVWIGENTPPWEWINTFKEELAANHPDWKYTLWREEDIKQLELINQWAYNDETQLSGKVNILRYELLHQFGGVYIDADMEWLNKKSLDDLIYKTNYTGLFAGKEDDSLLANSVIGCSKGNPIMALLIKVLAESYSTTRKDWKLPTWQATGPQFFTEMVKSFNITQFPTYYFYPVSWLQNHVGIDTNQFPHSYMIQYGYSTNSLGDSPKT